MPVRPAPAVIEIKANVGAADDADAVRESLGFRNEDARSRQIWFYEYVHGIGGPAALPLLGHDLIIRVRRRQNGKGDLTVKVRGKDIVLPDAWSTPMEGDDWKFKIEGDWTGERHAVAASIVADFDADRGRGATPVLDRIFTDRHFDFLHRVAELPIDVSALRGLGPIEARVWDPAEVGFEHKVAAESWHVESLHFLELSLRVASSEASNVQAAFGKFSLANGASLDADQEPKTTMVLRRLAKLDH